MSRIRLFIVSAAFLLVVGSCGDDDPVTPAGPGAMAPNGWPRSHAPANYMGEGYAIGDLIPDFTASDQFGNDDVKLTQFYGATVIIQFGGDWCVFCNQADGHLASTMDSLNGLYSNMTFWVIDAFDAQSGAMDSTRAANHATTYGLDFPVLFGSEIEVASSGLAIVGYPVFVFLDPDLRLQARHVGGGPDPTAVIQNARTVADSFLVRNPNWKSPF